MSGAFSRAFCRSDAGESSRHEVFLASQKSYNESIEISKLALKQSFDKAISQTQVSPKAKKELPFYIPTTKKDLKGPKFSFKPVENIYPLPGISVTDSPAQKFRKQWESKITVMPESKKTAVDDSHSIAIDSESSGERTEMKDMESSNEEIFTFDDNKEEESQYEQKQEDLGNDQEIRLPKTPGGIKAFLSARCCESLTWKNAVIEIAGQMSLFSSSTSE